MTPTTPKREAIVALVRLGLIDNWYRLSRYTNVKDADAAIDNVAYEIAKMVENVR